MIINVTPDVQKIRAMIRLLEQREKFSTTIQEKEYPTMALETYYEIAKEIGNAVLLQKGKKAIGENAHKDMIDELVNEKLLSEKESILFHDMRIKRNHSYYEGREVQETYIANRKNEIQALIKALKKKLMST